VKALAPLEARGCLRLPKIPENVVSAYHLFYILLNNAAESERARHRLAAQGILAAFHYFPLHLSRMGKRYGYRRGDLPVTESVHGRLLRLPFYNTMTTTEQQTVIQALRNCF
jgi:dTDP-4-amino-4,6-dideoxygalactose transaminase